MRETGRHIPQLPQRDRDRPQTGHSAPHLRGTAHRPPDPARRPQAPPSHARGAEQEGTRWPPRRHPPPPPPRRPQPPPPHARGAAQEGPRWPPRRPPPPPPGRRLNRPYWSASTTCGPQPYGSAPPTPTTPTT